MADQVLTKQKLINADEDLGDLEDVLNGPPGKLVKTRLGREVYTLASVPQINTMTREEVTAAVAPKANKADVDTAFSNLSTTANKYYSTLASANADIANIALNQSVTIGEAANGGLWYKATAGATSLTKSPYDAFELMRAFVNGNPLFSPKNVPSGTNINTLSTGYWIVPSESVAATLTGLPPQLTQPRRGSIFVLASGTTSYQKFTRDFSSNCEAYERTGNGKSWGGTEHAWLDWMPADLYSLENKLKTYVHSNPLFRSVVLNGTENFDTLPEGRYFIPSLAVATALDAQLPPTATSPKIGWVEKTYNNNSLVELVFSRYTANLSGEYEIFRKTSNGGGSSLIWLPWQKDVSRYEYESNKTALSSSIATMQALKAEVNLFPNFALTSDSSSTYQATLADEGGYPTLTLNTGGVTLVAYDVDVVPNILDVGRVITFSAEGFCSATGNNSGDLSIQALSSSGVVLATSPYAYIGIANVWQKRTTTLTIPANTAKIRLRMINRNGTGNTVCKFRDATLISDYAFLKFINPTATADIPSSIFHVSKTGNDNNSGLSSASAFLTLQKAVNLLPPHGGVIEVGGGVYRETVTISSKGNVWIRSKRNERAILFGSDQLVVSKSAGYTQVYQAPLAAKPVGMGNGRGNPVIFEWGTPSKPILEYDLAGLPLRHHLHRSRTHRLPYTEMFEAANKAELDTVGGRGKWFWEGGVIYFAATDGSNATLKQYEARVRPTIIQTDGVLHLTRIDAFFSTAPGGNFSGIMVDREDCRTFGNYHNGFSDNTNIVKSLYDEAGGNGNDGINGTVTSYNVPDVNTRLIAHYIEPYCHDNSDDGLSYHYRGNVRIDGGLCEYNTKADVVHVTGATCVCDGTVVQGTLNGFFVATTATGDSERTASYFKCINTTARNNTYSYRAADDAVMECENTKAINPTGYGYYQTGAGAINALDCKYSGDSSKKKSGTVNVTNTESLT